MGRSVSGSSSVNTFMTTVSPVGFTAGDLVYNTPLGIGAITTTPTGTASFPVSGDAPYSPTGVQSLAGTIKYVENYGGSTVTQCVAQLTNGNIVIAYGLRSTPASSATATAYFKITDTSDNIVVPQTIVSTSNQLNAGQPVGVLALPNGKFVIIFLAPSGGTPRLYYAIYNSDGTVSTALTFDSTFTGSSGTFNLAFAARSDSSFVVVTYDNSPQSVYRVISSTGTIIYSGTYGTPAATAGQSCALSVVVRPDDSFAVTLAVLGGVMYWQLFSSTNTSLASSTFSPTAGGTLFGCKMVLEPSSVVRLVYYTTSGFYTRTLTGTTMSAETTLQSVTLNQYSGFSLTSLGGSGGFVITYSADPSTYTTNATYKNGKLVYEFYNSSGTRLAGPTRVKSINNYNQGGLVSGLVVGSEIRFYKSSSNTYSSTYAYYPRSIYYAKVNTTTYAIVPFKTLNTSLGSVTAAAGSLAKSLSTITSATFYPASTSTTTVGLGPSTSTPSSQFKSQTILDSSSCYGVAATAMDNGDIVIAYQYQGASNQVYFSVYNSLGVFQSTVTVSNGAGNPGFYYSVRCFQAYNGNLVVCFRGSSNIIYYRIYSPTYTLLYSGNLGFTVYGNQYSWNAAPIGVDGRFVIAFLDSSQTERWAVYDSTGTFVTNGGTGEQKEVINVVGFRSGDFISFGASSSNGNNRFHYYGWNSGSSYSNYNNNGFGSWSPYYISISVGVSPDDIGMIFGYDGGSATTVYGFPAGVSNQTFFGTNNISLNAGSSGCVSIGFTGNGDPVGFIFPNSVPSYYEVQNGSGLETWSFSASAGNLGGGSWTSANNSISIAPFAGDACIVAYLDSSQRPNFAVFYASLTNYSATITAGVTPSTPITLSYANRYALMGVALTNCSAGGAGIIQTNGTAAISSSYPSMTAAPFDFRNNTTYGVSGTVSGRIVTMGA